MPLSREKCEREMHVDRGLMMRQHQSDKIDIAVARPRDRPHGHVHLVHARNQFRPIRAEGRPTVVPVSFCLNAQTERSNTKDQQ
jgi:hypothetical protein